MTQGTEVPALLEERKFAAGDSRKYRMARLGVITVMFLACLSFIPRSEVVVLSAAISAVMLITTAYVGAQGYADAKAVGCLPAIPMAVIPKK